MTETWASAKQPMILHDRPSILRTNKVKSVTSSPLRAPPYQQGLNPDEPDLDRPEPFPHFTSIPNSTRRPSKLRLDTTRQVNCPFPDEFTVTVDSLNHSSIIHRLGAILFNETSYHLQSSCPSPTQRLLSSSQSASRPSSTRTEHHNSPRFS
jgi:hypothetical protein